MRKLALTLLLLPAAAGAQEIAPGRPAPEIDLPTLQGGHVKLSALRGHPVVVTFWGTWCPPCREEFPGLVAAYQQYHQVGLEVLAVNQSDQELRTSDVQAFVTARSVEFTLLSLLLAAERPRRIPGAAPLRGPGAPGVKRHPFGYLQHLAGTTGAVVHRRARRQRRHQAVSPQVVGP